MSPEHILLVLCILFGGALIRASLGFGDALITMPLISLTIGIRYATPLVAMITVIQSVFILWGKLKYIDLRSSWRLVLSSFLGIPVGLYAFQNVPEHIVISFMGVILVVYGLYSLFTPRLPHVPNENLAFPFGFVAGIVGGAYNTKGPPIVIYGTLRRWPPELFRVTLQSYFIPTGLMIALGHLFSGMWTYEVLLLFVLSLPLLMIATVLGRLLSSRISRRAFGQIIYAFLVIIGAFMIV